MQTNAKQGKQWLNWQKALVLAAVALGLTLGVGVGNWATAGDSGEEKVVWITPYKCWGCDQVFYTLLPDSLNMKVAENKLFDHQQKNWVYLKNGNSIAKCPKMSDGAHIMDEGQSFPTTATLLTKNMDRVILLKNGRGSKVKLAKVKCAHCGLSRLAFEGDDLDLHGAIVLSEQLHIKNLRDQSSLEPCKGKLPTGRELKAHVFTVTGGRELSKSYDLLGEAKNIIYSD